MASIIPGFEYDIFISYRQKDNKGDRWVSEFVEALKTELESTFKEEISVYFDINPHDGLLETHDVDASLKEKLKCLVFIPIISRTYCDPNSFAWEHEFKTFLDQASHDQYGLMVKLPNGNVANRVYPVRIHDLDKNDIKLCESVLGGVIRGVEFIYKEPGVNRSLTPYDDEKVNLNKTRYRNQINKVALGIKEIISGLKKESEEYITKHAEYLSPSDVDIIQERSIIVLPFENISSDPEQEYFSDGLTEEIITDLSHIQNLLVISRSSAMTFKGTKKKIKEIAGDVNVHYVLEGSVRKSGNNLRITAQLIDGINDTHIWAEKYSGTLENIFDIQEKVSRSIAEALKIKLSSAESKRIITKLIENPSLYEYYLKAKYEMNQLTEESLIRAIRIIEDAIDIFGENALLYATLGDAYYIFYDMGIDTDEKILNKVEEYAKKALLLEPEIAQGLKLYGLLELGGGSLIESYNYIKKAFDTDPNDPGILAHITAFTGAYLGKSSYSDLQHNKLLSIDPLSAVNFVYIALAEYFQGSFENAIHTLRKSFHIDPYFFISNFWVPTILAANGQKNEALEFADKINREISVPKAFKELNIFIKYVLTGKKAEALAALSDETKKYTWKDPLFSGLMPGYYTLIDEKEEALKYLEHAIDRDFINYPFFSEIDPFLGNLRNEKPFKKLMERVKIKWENFEV
jgi:TolB-like protein